MSHPILNEHPDMVAFQRERSTLADESTKALADQEARAVAYNEALERAMAAGSPLPTPPQSAATVGQAFAARHAALDRRQQAWLEAHRDELVTAADDREDAIMADVAEHVAALESASAELHLLNSMNGHIAHRTMTPRRDIAHRFGPVELIAISKAGRLPLRWDEPPSPEGHQSLVGAGA